MQAARHPISGIKQQRVEQHAFFFNKNFIAALKTLERPALPAGGAAGAKPVHQYQSAARRKVKRLPLRVTGTGEGLNGIGREHEQRVCAQRGGKLMAAGARFGIAIHLGGGLRADEATGLFTDVQRDAGLITGHESAAKTAEIGPDARPARPGDQDFQGTGGPGRSHGALAGDDFNSKMAAACEHLSAVHKRGVVEFRVAINRVFLNQSHRALHYRRHFHVISISKTGEA
jgi:hypothetical protein